MIGKIPAGWREWVSLPALGVPAVKAKLDTGARTSALHVSRLRTFRRDGQPWVRFHFHPLRRRPGVQLTCEAPMHDRRLVRDSGGHAERRPVIHTLVGLGEDQWPIEITLTNREDMLFRMLLGRTALAGRLLVDPDRSFLLGRWGRRCYRQWTRTGEQP